MTKNNNKRGNIFLASILFLIAFPTIGLIFMIVSTFIKPRVMEINMPDKPKDKNENPPELKESNAFIVLLADSNKIY
jgi:hypothetical protein